MIPTVVIPPLVQVLLPLALIACVAVGRHRYRARWWLLVALAWTWIVAIGVAGMWLVVPWYLYLVWVALLAMAMPATWRREVTLPFWPQSAISRIGAMLLGAGVLGTGFVLAYALDGRLSRARWMGSSTSRCRR